ncbi:Sensor protein KdpD [compost metagenome]
MKLSQSAEKLIRRGFRTAFRLKADWIVAYVHSAKEMTEDERKKKESLENLTVRLGGKFEMISSSGPSSRLAEVIQAKADEHRATQLIIGQCDRPAWKRLWEGTIIKKLLRTARHMDILIVANYDPHIKREVFPDHSVHEQ